MSRFFELHVVGGINYMTPLALLLFSNLALIAFVSFRLAQKREIHSKWIESIKHIGILAAAWGTFGTVVALFLAFDALENLKEVLPFQVIMGGLKVAMITMWYGLLIFCISMLGYIILKLIRIKLTV